MRKYILLLSTMILLHGNYGFAAIPEKDLQKIQHIIIISLENHSFDNLFAHFPGADGIDNAGKAAIQTDKTGQPFAFLPPVMDTEKKPAIPDNRFPNNLPNKLFAIDDYVPKNEKTGDLVHRFYQEQLQINKGKMDRFAAISNAGGLTMGYYKAEESQLWKYAQKYTLADHFFHAAFGGSFLNHFWLVCACTPKYKDAPNDLRIKLNNKGEVEKDGAVTEDGYAVNTIFSVFAHPANISDPKKLLPPQKMDTIGDLLNEKKISWVWYSGGWDDFVSGRPAKTFEFHHQPFMYFANIAGNPSEKAEHLKDETEFLEDIKSGSLPAVSFYKPLGEFDFHPGYADINSGDEHLGEILHAIENSPEWVNSLVIVTFDENGGYWDHIAPPVVDEWGPGVRVPALIISPYAKRGFVDHTVYDTTSILKMIEERFDLSHLSSRDKKANDFKNALSFH